MFRFRCPKCGQTIEVPMDLTGSPCPVCGTVIGDSAESALRLSPGDRIGGYEIVQLLGSGGTGNVYLALQLSMSRQIALKVLYPELTENRDSVNQFLGEIKTLGIIQHTHIVTAFDSGMDKERGLYYLAMQYISGQPLDAVVAQSGPLPIPKALKIVESIASALSYVWTKYQLCHRDIKPGNIMLDDDDMPMLLDFGAVLHSSENSISNGLVEGSPCFMSPEQARGEKLTFASDLYSLGETLYYLIVGVAPFEDPNVREILRKQCEAPFPPPEQRKPGSNIPAEVVSFLRMTMAKSPVDRFDSWESFLAELKKVKKAVSGKGSPAKAAAARPARSGAKPAGTSPAVRPEAAPRRRHPILLAINYLLITLLTAGTIAFMLARSNTQSAENRMVEVRAAMKNVRENDKDPDGAKDKIRRALAESRKFGVKEEVAQAIRKECSEELQFIESLEKENRQVEQFQLTVSSLMTESMTARTGLKRKDPKESKESFDQLTRIRTELLDQSAKIQAFAFVRPSNKEKMRHVVEAVNKQAEEISELLRSTSVASKMTPGQTDKKVAAGKKKKAAPLDEKTRKKMSAEEKLRRKKETAAYRIVLNVREGRLEDVEQLLKPVTPGKASGLAPGTEAAYNTWLAGLSEIYRETKPVLSAVPHDITDKKEKIYSLIGGENKKLLSRSLMLFGYFSEAQRVLQPEDRELFRDIYEGYLTPLIRWAVINAEKRNGKELTELRKEYEKFKPYTELENKVRARINGGK